MEVTMVLSPADKEQALIHHLCEVVGRLYVPTKRLFILLPDTLLSFCAKQLWQQPKDMLIPHAKWQGPDWPFTQMVMMGSHLPVGIALDCVIHQNSSPLRHVNTESIVELVQDAPATTEAARARYRYYQTQQWPVKVINQR